jgi:hypothetical protein
MVELAAGAKESKCNLTRRFSACVGEKVPSPNCCDRGAQVNIKVAHEDAVFNRLTSVSRIAEVQAIERAVY